MDLTSGSELGGGGALRTTRLTGWSTVALLAAGLVGCGGATRNGATRGGDGDGAGLAGGAAAGGAVGGESGEGGGSGSNSVPSGGSTAATGIDLEGSPKYFRFVRLTNSQWAASVREVLRLAAPSGLETAFAAPVTGTTDFANNELLLEVDSRAWADFEAAAEKLAEQVTASDAALAAVYPGTDAEGFIKTVGRRAYRRPLTAAEVSKQMAIFTTGAAMTGDKSAFAKGAALVIRAFLQGPKFLYRSELGPSGEALSGYEAAAKLSLWLRDATPDDALLDEADKLTSVDALAEEATKMIADAPATAVMRQFHGQLWRLDRLSQISKVGVPTYDPSLNPELLESSYLFFDRIFKQGLGVRDILTSTHGFMGPGMAALYGLSPPKSGFVERDLGATRVGYFSQLPYLTLYGVNAVPDSLHRGLDLLLNVLCAPLGARPSVLPTPPERKPSQTNREYLEQTTQSCASASCHANGMNPLGFAFEHFDGIGQYRETEKNGSEGLPIDSSGSYTFTTGNVDFADNVELMAAMAESPEAHLCYAKKLAGFALQRDIVMSDLPWLTQLANLSHDESGSTKQIMVELVKSNAFRTHSGGAQ
ncbi:MAG: DUF1592 domain-containing protein [Polyangiaceae bacterium]